MSKPVLQALVLADHIYIDYTTKKKIIAGTFHNLWAKKFPSQFSRTTNAFISLTDLRGETQLTLRYRNLDDDKELMSLSFSITEENPLNTYEVIVDVPGFPMPKPGAYAFDLLYQEEVLGSLRILVAKREE